MTVTDEMVERALETYWKSPSKDGWHRLERADMRKALTAALSDQAGEANLLRDDLRALRAADQSELRICEHCDAWMTVEEAARVDDASLCPKEAYGSLKFPNEKCFKHRAWLVKEDQKAARTMVAAAPPPSSTAGEGNRCATFHSL